MNERWSHLIRFTQNGKQHYGNAVFPQGTRPDDITTVAREGRLKAKIISGDPFSDESLLSGDEVTVDKLLCPLAQEQVPIIRCVGLNYMKHSEATH